jgi:uncharacterized circularly permuted ATP-grasp superfamily protein
VDGFGGYLLPCHGVAVTGNRPLVLYGADLTRDASSGRWRVIGDRTQTPSGSGYALENRVVLSRVLPSLFRDSHVHRLAGFYRSVRRAMIRLAPRGEDHARVALMTPGPSNAAYFEHAYLANYLGYTLVQGGPLGARRRALAAHAGPAGAHRCRAAARRRLLVRPLELREDSLLGVPGLVQAVRAGNLTVANALGSGVLEHPGLMAFLPQLCQHLLGEELLVPHLRTWWCGRREDRDFVIANLDSLVIKPAGTRTGGPAARAVRRKLSGRSATEWSPRSARALRLCRAGGGHAVHGAGLHRHGHIEPRPFVLRSFLVSEEEGYAVMPGG